ncbi:MAG: OmpH family outer membrane protein [Culturomica sp.]|jgi:outer membrane protein|nr:OmpH family outer membrane protein [Culturomica sp.]
MKNLSIALNVVLLLAIAVLYVLHFSGRNGKADAENSEEERVPGDIAKIVYINTDTLLTNYALSVELNEAFLKKQEERRTELNMKTKQLDQEATDFQRKVENNGFISRERAEAAQMALQDKYQKLQLLQQEMSEKMMQEDNELKKRLFEEITNFLTEYNREKGHNIILSTVMAGTVLYAQDGFDITQDVLKGLNAAYRKK